MIPYVLIVIIPALFCFVAVDRSEAGGRRICIGSGKMIRSSNLAVPVFFVMLFFLLALRHESIGRDLLGYKSIFRGFSHQRIDNLVKFEPEALYAVLNWGIGQITNNYQWFLVIMAVLTIPPIASIYNEDRRYGYLKIILFLNMSTFIMLFSGLRQSLAMAIGMLAYRAVRKNRLILFLALTLVAIGIHHSGFMILFMYPLYHVRLKMKHLWVIFPGMLTVLLFNRQIFGVLTRIAMEYSDKYETEMTSTGAYGSLFLFILFAVFAFVVADEGKMDKEMFGLRNFLLFAVILQSFAPLHYLAMRLNYYFILFIPLIVPKVVASAKPGYKQVAQLGHAVMCVFFTFVYLSSTYESYLTGISTLDTIPYVPFWRG